MISVGFARQGDGKQPDRIAAFASDWLLFANWLSCTAAQLKRIAMGQDVARPLNCNCLFSASIVCPAASLLSDSTLTRARVTDGLGIECPPRLDGVRVLVVDDDSDTRQMSKAVISECQADDVLVSDLRMPEQDGYELIKGNQGDGIR